MNASITVKATLNTPGDWFIVAWAAASAPGVIIGYVAPAGPYTSSFQVTATGLTSQLYIFTLYENTTNTPGGTVRCNCNLQPSSSTVTLRSDLYLTADVSSGLTSGTTGYVDPTNSLVGWTYDLEEVGYGTLQYGGGNDYTLDANNNWVLVSQTVQGSQKFVIHFQPQVSQAPQAPPSLISSGLVITTATTLTSSNVNTALLLQGSGSVLPITLPALSSISDWQQIILYSAGGTHINAPIICAGVDKIQWWVSNSISTVNQLVLGQNETLKLYKAFGVWNVDYADPGIRMAGEFMFNYEAAPINTTPCDGLTRLRANYVRLWNYVNSSGAAISDAAWGNTTTINGVTRFTNKGFFSIGDGSTTFRMPLLSYYGYVTAIDGSTRQAGNFQPDGVGIFNPKVTGPILAKGGTSDRVIVVGNINDASLGTATGSPITITGDDPNGLTHSQNIGMYALIRC